MFCEIKTHKLENNLIIFGILPDYPATGYGYIKVRREVRSSKREVYKVAKFIEKPSLAKAKRLIKNKRCYWNAGIFIFRPDTLLDEIKKFAPREHRVLNTIQDKTNFRKAWSRFRNISIDYAVMEKTSRLLLLPASFGWEDLGSWQALERLMKKDKQDNILHGPCLDVGSRRIIAWSDNRLLATVGLQDVIVVDSADAVLVCAKNRAQDVRAVVQLLKRKKLNKQI